MLTHPWTHWLDCQLLTHAGSITQVVKSREDLLRLIAFAVSLRTTRETHQVSLSVHVNLFLPAC